MIRRLIWDSWNVAHISRHAVTPDEVEEVCHGQPISLDAYKGRTLLVGPTGNGRMVSVVLSPTPETDVYYPITARPSDKKERRIYIEQSNNKNI